MYGAISFGSIPRFAYMCTMASLLGFRSGAPPNVFGRCGISHGKTSSRGASISSASMPEGTRFTESR